VFYYDVKGNLILFIPMKLLTVVGEWSIMTEKIPFWIDTVTESDKVVMTVDGAQQYK